MEVCWAGLARLPDRLYERGVRALPQVVKLCCQDAHLCVMKSICNAVSDSAKTLALDVSCKAGVAA